MCCIRQCSGVWKGTGGSWFCHRALCAVPFFFFLRQRNPFALWLGIYTYTHYMCTMHVGIFLFFSCICAWECVCSLGSRVPVGLETIKTSCRSPERSFCKCHAINNLYWIHNSSVAPSPNTQQSLSLCLSCLIVFFFFSWDTFSKEFWKNSRYKLNTDRWETYLNCVSSFSFSLSDQSSRLVVRSRQQQQQQQPGSKGTKGGAGFGGSARRGPH